MSISSLFKEKKQIYGSTSRQPYMNNIIQCEICSGDFQYEKRERMIKKPGACEISFFVAGMAFHLPWSADGLLLNSFPNRNPTLSFGNSKWWHWVFSFACLPGIHSHILQWKSIFFTYFVSCRSTGLFYEPAQRNKKYMWAYVIYNIYA